MELDEKRKKLIADTERANEELLKQMALTRLAGKEFDPDQVTTVMTDYNDDYGPMQAAVNVLKDENGNPILNQPLGILPAEVYGENGVLDAATKAKAKYKEIIDRLRKAQ